MRPRAKRAPNPNPEARASAPPQKKKGNDNEPRFKIENPLCTPAYTPPRLIRSRAHGGEPDFISALGDCVYILVGNRVPLLLKREWSLKDIGLGIILAAALLSHSVAYIIYQTG